MLNFMYDREGGGGGAGRVNGRQGFRVPPRPQGPYQAINQRLQPLRQATPPAINQQSGPPAIQIKPVGERPMPIFSMPGAQPQPPVYQAGTAMASVPQPPQGLQGSGGIQPGGGLLDYLKQQGGSTPNPSPFQAGTAQAQTPRVASPMFGGGGRFSGGGAAGSLRGMMK